MQTLVTSRRILLSLLLAAAGGGLWYAFTSSADPTPPTYLAGIDAVFPSPTDSLNLRQLRVGVDFAAGYTGVLAIDGTEIPDDQVEKVAGLGQIFFHPGPGTETGTLEPGTHVATATFWALTTTRAEAKRYSWRFSVH